MTQRPSAAEAAKLKAERRAYEFEFRDWHFYWLAKADRAYSSKLATSLQRHGLDIPGWRVLMILHARQSASVTELADHSITKLSTMTKIVQRMQGEGLVDCKANPEDRRVTIVHITSRGDEIGEKAWQEAKRIANQAFSDFSERDLATLNELLRKLTTNLAN